MPPLFSKMKISHPIPKRSFWFTALVSGLSLAATNYFWFLQPRDLISKQRLILAGGLWFLISLALFYLFSFLARRLRSTSNNIILAIVTASLLSGGIYYFTINKNAIPNNLFLLPRQKITIEIKANETPREFRLTGFFNGLSPVSYSSLKLEGQWEIVGQSTLRYFGKGSASIQYTGWMVEKHFIEFEKTPNGGEAVIHWNSNDAEFINLSSVTTQKIKFDYPFPTPKVSKNSVVFITLVSFFIFFYPVCQLLINRMLGERDLIKFDLWFEETTKNLQKFTAVAVVICTAAAILLTLTPLFEQDKQTIDINKANRSEKPNIFLVIVDALSAEDMSMFGYPLETTPNLNRITQDWTVYAHAQTPSVCSIGVYPSLISGHYPYILRPFAQYGNQIQSSDNWTDIFQLLKETGYHTYWSGYLPPGFYHTGSEIDSTFGMPFNTQLMKSWFQMKAIRKQYFPYIPLIVQQPEKYPSIQYDDYRLSETMKMLEENKFPDPSFVYLHFDGVHVMPGIEWIYPAGSFQGAFLKPEAPNIRHQYDEAILNLDYLMSKFIDQLKQEDLYDQSMIILMADHGQVFRKGSLAQCSTEVTLNETHVPLLIKYPGQKNGEWVTDITSTIDLTPTILEIAGVHYQSDWFDGRSLLSTAPKNPYVFSGNTFLARYKNRIAVMDNQYKLVLRGDQYLLFDYRNDPNEENNLIPMLGMDSPIVQKLMDELNRQRNKIF